MTQVVDRPALQHGFVQGRFVTAIADTLDDEDRYPDLQGVQGNVRFEPVAPIHMTEGAHKATVIKQPVVANINSEGYVVDVKSAGDALEVPGVWLAVGRYNVRTVFNGSIASPGFTIEVTAEHTKESPLHLTDAAPIVLPPASVEVTRVIDRILAQQAAAEAMTAASVAAQDAAALVRDEVSADALTASTSATQAATVKAELEALFAGGTEAVNDAAVSTFVGTEGTATRSALSGAIDVSGVRVASHPRIRMAKSDPILRHEDQSANTMYLPVITDRAPMGANDIALTYSTDHASHADSGVFMVTFDRDFNTETRVNHGRIFRDEVQGNQTETPTPFMYDEPTDHWYFFYHQDNTPSVGIQTTLAAKSQTPLDPASWVRHGAVLPWGPGIGGTEELGRPHTGYAVAPFKYGGETYVVSLYSGGTYPQYRLWRKGDSGLDPWEPLHIFKSNAQMTSKWGGQTETPSTDPWTTRMTRNMKFDTGQTFMFGGAPWWLGTIGASTHAGAVASQRIVTAPLHDDLTTFAAIPTEITPPGLDGLNSVTGITQIDGRTYTIAQTNSPQGEFWLMEIF